MPLHAGLQACQPSGTPLVAASRGSGVRLAIAFSAITASATVRPCGPTVSCVCEMGTTPARLTTPIVGLNPTTPLTLPGQTMLPSVSLPNEIAAKLADAAAHGAAAAAPDPDWDPHGWRSSEYGWCVRPPRPDQPLLECVERKFAHSDRFVLPRMTGPAARSLAATVESWTAGRPASANEPAVVCILSPVSMLSFNSSGMPSSGYFAVVAPERRSASAFSASSIASGFSSITELTPGPR